MSPSTLQRAVITVGWFILLAAFLRWWEITLRLPTVLLWTTLFTVIFVGTAASINWAQMLDVRHPAWRRPALWLSLVVVALIGFTVVPLIAISGAPVRTVAFAGVLDVVLPGWIMVTAIPLLWKGWARWGVFAAIPVLLLLGTWGFVIRMPGTSYAGTLQPLTVEQVVRRDALQAHVSALSSDIGERNGEMIDELDAAAQYVDSVLSTMGYVVRTEAFEYSDQRFSNLEVERTGFGDSDEIVVVGAHYDSVEGAPGADDNASGTAGVLELARLFAAERPYRTVRFVLFTNEEPPFFDTEWMGSRVYAARAEGRQENIVAMLSLETIGYYSTEEGSQQYPPPFSFFYPNKGNFIAFVGNLGSGPLVRRSLAAFRSQSSFPSEGVASPSWIPGITWSDHASFWLHGYKAVMISDTAPFRNPYYHTELDTVDKLDFDRMTRVVDGIAAVVRRLASDD